MGVTAHPFDPLPHPPPLALLKAVRVAPRAILFNEGHLLSPIAMLGEHDGGQRINLCAWEEPRPNTSLP